MPPDARQDTEPRQGVKPNRRNSRLLHARLPDRLRSHPDHQTHARRDLVRFWKIFLGPAGIASTILAAPYQEGPKNGVEIGVSSILKELMKLYLSLYYYYT